MRCQHCLNSSNTFCSASGSCSSQMLRAGTYWISTRDSAATASCDVSIASTDSLSRFCCASCSELDICSNRLRLSRLQFWWVCKRSECVQHQKQRHVQVPCAYIKGKAGVRLQSCSVERKSSSMSSDGRCCGIWGVWFPLGTLRRWGFGTPLTLSPMIRRTCTRRVQILFLWICRVRTRDWHACA